MNNETATPAPGDPRSRKIASAGPSDASQITDRSSLPPRPAVPEDQPAVVACVQAAYARYLERMDGPPAPMTADYGARIAAGSVWVLPGGSGVAGVLVMWPEGDHLFLENIAVAPAEQGQGAGRRLMAAVEAHARSLGLTAITLYTNEAMTENLAWYPRLGFVETGRRVEDGFRRVYFRKQVPSGTPPAP